MSDQTARQDLLATSDTKLGKALEAAIEGRGSAVPPDLRAERRTRALEDKGLAVRKALIEGERADPKGFERIIGASDLLSINFLDRGRRAANAVCRIKLPVDGGLSFGTGSLVGPRLLLTNNHVIATAAEAAQAEAEFAYEADLDGVVLPPIAFNLDPQSLFFTSTDLDITLVAVAPFSGSGVPVERFGWLPLLPVSGKSVDGEWVTIIQHPDGLPKQIAIHASQIVKLTAAQVPGTDLDRFIHYSTDTEPGSSGAPVLNDQWQVIAVHHKAVPAPDRGDGEEAWLANEGVRVSAIYRHLEAHRFTDPSAGRALDILSRSLGFRPVATAVAEAGTFEQRAPFALTRWSRTGLGYDPDFLSERIDFASIYAGAKAAGIVAPLKDGSGERLDYSRFSVVMHGARRFPLLTAVNIDGKKLRKVKRVDQWRLDARMDAKFQSDDKFYVRTLANEKVFFSRGHQVRLLDPCWGDDDDAAKRGMEDTFHFTNAAPQVQGFNDEDWGNLEDYVLEKAQGTERKLTVLQGPIFREDDPLYGIDREGGPWRIPLSYWKVAVLQKTDTTIAAAAFIVGQTEYVKALFEARVFTGLRPYTIDEMRQRGIQTTIATVEAESGLDLSALRPFDAQGSLEATRQTRLIASPAEILI